jgi:hypothetical protein
MSRRDQDKDKPAAPPASAPAPAKSSGRVKFDERGQAVWEWQLKTGRFDLDVDSARIRALTQTELSVDDPTAAPPPPTGGGMNPYENVPRNRPKPAEKPGGDPYSQGPARRPETVNYNPYQRPTPKKSDR